MPTLIPDVRQFAAEFERRGFVIIPGVLSPDETARLNRAVDGHLRDYPAEWAELSDSLLQTPSILSHVPEFDATIEHTHTLGMVRSILGEEVSFEELGVMIRNPTQNLDEVKGWHRDITRDYDRRHEIDAVSVVFYLTDVTADDHCFSIVPETHRRCIDMRPTDVRPGDEVDILAPAGSAVIFHARCIHNGKLKPHSRPRRTIHIYYSRANGPRTSEWTEIPERLYRKSDPELPPRLYCKWNVTDIFDGTGKKPRGLDRSLPFREQLRMVQKLAREQNLRT